MTRVSDKLIQGLSYKLTVPGGKPSIKFRIELQRKYFRALKGELTILGSLWSSSQTLASLTGHFLTLRGMKEDPIESLDTSDKAQYI